MRTFLKRLLTFCAVFSFAISMAAQTTEPQIGYASLYSTRFQDKKTASGETYDGAKFTASHKTLPFGTYILVTNIATNKSVKVKVNDRGPFVDGRITDLSLAAAQKIGINSSNGKVQVKLEVLNSTSTYVPNRSIYLNKAPDAGRESVAVADVSTKPSTRNDVPTSYKQPSRSAKNKPIVKAASTQELTPKGVAIYGEKYPYAVQVASMASKENAVAMKRKLEAKNLRVLMYVDAAADSAATYKVLLGPFDNKKAAQLYKNHARDKHKIDGFVVTATSAK